MNDTFLVGVLDRLANLGEEVESVFGRELVFVAILIDRNAFDQFHHEVGSTGVSGSGVEDFGDVGMVHHRERLAFGLKAGDDVFGVHPEFDDFEGDVSADGFLLFGHEDRPHAALRDKLKDLISTDDGSRAFGQGAV